MHDVEANWQLKMYAMMISYYIYGNREPEFGTVESSAHLNWTELKGTTVVWSSEIEALQSAIHQKMTR